MAVAAAKDVKLHITDEAVKVDVLPGAAPVSAESLCQMLHDAGVSHGIDKNALAALSKKITNKEEVKQFLVAQCTPPTNPKPGRLERLIQIGQVAAAGDVIAEVIPGESGDHGINVKGELIEALAGQPVKLHPGENTEVDYGKLKATCYGVVKFKDNLISVVPPLQIAFDKMSATIDIHPTSQIGTPITTQAIVDTLTLFGINYGVSHDAIDDAIENASINQATEFRVEVAKGLLAKAAKPVDFEFFFTVNGSDPKAFLLPDKKPEETPAREQLTLVNDGDRLCRIIPATPATAGKNIYSEDIKPPPVDGSKIASLACGDNVVLNEDREFIANILHRGYVYIEDKKIYVKPPITIAEDQMSATLLLFSQKDATKQLQKKDVMEILSGMGVRFGILEEAIDTALQKAGKDDGEPMHVEIARGQEGKTGKDAYLEFLINTDKKVGLERADGSMDFRERGTIINVKKDDAICKRIAPESGRSQVTVTGETFPASSGQDIEFVAGESVVLKDDTFFAMQNGALMFRDKTVNVSDIYQHQGDINLSSGNLHQSKGAIHVTGSITSGFEVKANSHVSVNETVDNGRIISGGDVFVKGGVIQPENGDGYIHCMGNVSARFLQNAKIYSYQNVTVNDFVMNSLIHAKGDIEVTKGKGCIVGGITKSSKSIHAKQLGSEAGAVTHIEIEYDAKEVKAIYKAINQKTVEVEAGQADRSELDELFQRQKELYKKTEEVAEIKIAGVMYPGVTVKILGVSTEITEEKRFCKITLTPKKALLFSPYK